MIRVEEYTLEDGSCPYTQWFYGLDTQIAAKVTTYLTRIEEGNTSSLKPLKGAFQKVVIDWGPGYRVYVGKDGEKLVILLGGEPKGDNKRILTLPKNFGKNIKKEKKVNKMAITRDFKETIKNRALKDQEFRKAILTESIECMLAGDTKTGKALLRNYINAVVGFERLGQAMDKGSKSLMRMLSDKGNPTADNYFQIVSFLQEQEGIHYELHAVR